MERTPPDGRRGAFRRVLARHARRPLPLLNRLLLSIETHALCGALAFFAMLGFYPLSLLLISLAKYVLRSPDAHQVVRLAVQSYYPAGQEFLLRNLEASVVAAARRDLARRGAVDLPRRVRASSSRSRWRSTACGASSSAGPTGTTSSWASCSRWPCWAIARRAGAAGEPRALCRIVRRPCAVAAPTLAAAGHLPGLPAAAARPRARAASRSRPRPLTAAVCEVVRWVFLLLLPWLDLSRSHGPFQVSVSFLMFAYVESFVLLAGADIAAEATRERPRAFDGPSTAGVASAGREEARMQRGTTRGGSHGVGGGDGSRGRSRGAADRPRGRLVDPVLREGRPATARRSRRPGADTSRLAPRERADDRSSARWCADGTYPDPYVGTNLRTDPGNHRTRSARTSRTCRCRPTARSRVPWWYPHRVHAAPRRRGPRGCGCASAA